MTTSTTTTTTVVKNTYIADCLMTKKHSANNGETILCPKIS